MAKYGDAGGNYCEAIKMSDDTNELARLRRAQRDLLSQKQALSRKIKTLRAELGEVKSGLSTAKADFEMAGAMARLERERFERQLKDHKHTSLARLIWIREKLIEHDLHCEYDEDDWILAIDNMIRWTAAQFEVIDVTSSKVCTDQNCQGQFCSGKDIDDSIESIKEKIGYEGRLDDVFIPRRYSHTIFSDEQKPDGSIPF